MLWEISNIISELNWQMSFAYNENHSTLLISQITLSQPMKESTAYVTPSLIGYDFGKDVPKSRMDYPITQ